MRTADATARRRVIRRSHADHERREEMEVEFIGGAFDGMRLYLEVVKDEPGHIRVLEMAYDHPPERDIAAEIRHQS